MNLLGKIKQITNSVSRTLKRFGQFLLVKLESESNTFWGWFVLIVVYVAYVSCVFVTFHATFAILYKWYVRLWVRFFC